MAKAPNVPKTIYFDNTPMCQVVLGELEQSGSNQQANARRWLILGYLAERAGFRVSEMSLDHFDPSVLDVVPRASARPVPSSLTTATKRGPAGEQPVVAVRKEIPEGLRANLQQL